MNSNERSTETSIEVTNRFFAYRRQYEWLDGSKPLKLIFNVEVFGVCNLRCPSCPQGCNETTESPSRKQFMDVDYFAEVVKKIRSESTCEQMTIALYNWGEPLLHPEIEQLVQIANDAGFATSLSSNMSHMKNLEAAVRANVRYFRMSLSGVNKETYGFYHRRGETYTVVKNLHRLKELREAYGQDKPPPEICFHWYKDNLDEDYERISEICRNLGFRLVNKIARIYPLERILRGFRDGWQTTDKELLGRLLVRPEEFSAIANKHTKKSDPCILQNAEISINSDGSVLLCCVCFEDENIIADNFLEVPLQDLFYRKAVHQTCMQCKALNYHQSNLMDAHPAVLQATRNRIGKPLPGDELR